MVWKRERCGGLSPTTDVARTGNKCRCACKSSISLFWIDVPRTVVCCLLEPQVRSCNPRHRRGTPLVSRYKIAQAASLVRRYEEIRAGYWWQPIGWGHWYIHAAVGEFDTDSVCADAIKLADGKIVYRLNIAWRVNPNDLMGGINAGFAELRACRPDAIEGDPEALPLPGSNDELVLKLQQDSIDLTMNQHLYGRYRVVSRRSAKTGKGVAHHLAKTPPTLS